MSRLLVAGSLAYDRIMVFPGRFEQHLLKDALHSINVCFSVTPPKEEFGGCAGNIAYTLSLLGGAPVILATAGNDFARYEEHLKEEGVATTPIQVYGDVPSSSFYVITDEGNNQIGAFSHGADAKPYTYDIDFNDVVLAIVAPTGVEDMREFPEKFKEANVPYLFDPGQQITSLSADELRSGISSSRALLVNDYELALIVEKTEWDEERIASETEMLIVTLGGAGSRIRTRDEAFHIEAVAAKSVVDPTGAGDAYRAGFMHALAEGLSAREAMQVGSAVAAYAVECYGTQNHRFTLDELKTRYEDTYHSSFPL
ncbi:carbohydrate kinase family protein [Patescibacteria group bacterium]|nr:carbohydrate kinase family protein [Patescibacteria group bacterium]